jgi:hypothetical protein
MKRTSGTNSFGTCPNTNVSRREPSEVATKIEIVPRSAAERSVTGSRACRKLQLFNNRSISAISPAEAAEESRDQAFGTGTCSPVWIASILSIISRAAYCAAHNIFTSFQALVTACSSRLPAPNSPRAAWTVAWAARTKVAFSPRRSQRVRYQMRPAFFHA